jgi:hypothetical protein
VACALVTTAAAVAAEALPPQLVARLEQDRAVTERQLAATRTTLGRAATAQRVATARHELVRARIAQLEQVAALVESDLPTAIDEAADQAEQTALEQREQADELLELRSVETAEDQSRALDADRRLRALRRASATADDLDATLGSWRFGSGGPSVSAESIDRYLATKGSPLVGQGAAFLEAGVEHEVDPRLIVAIAGAESYFGIETCASFNAWGWGCPTGPFAFRSWAHAIDTVTLGLREGYLDDGLESVGAIHLRYAPPGATNDPGGLNYAWPDNVARFLVEQGGDPEQVAGVLGPSR